MKMSQAYIPTLKETPAEAEVVSHQLMLRAGMMRKLSSGIYTYLPLGQKVIQKVEEIVREEMNREGAQELLLPALQPAKLWKESERWEDYGPELMRLNDRHNRDFCLGPTHEEVITDLVRDEVRSYKDLPLNLYQIQTKFRDEIRPRFGVLRGREFIMKDAYSFDINEEALEESYQKMYDAYSRIFARCGLEFRPVAADNGAIGGSESHEFMVLADSGEDTVVFCNDCDYAANLELAISDVEFAIGDQEVAELDKVETPGADTIEALAEFLECSTKQLIKTLAYETDEGYVLALVRGDYQLNEVKLRNVLGVPNLEMADGEELFSATRIVTGFAGAIDIPNDVKVIADPSVMEIVNGVTGANEADYHYVNVNPQRDFTVDEVVDIREIKENEACVECGGDLTLTKGIEVGQVFKLGTKYSESMGATYLDNNGKAQPMVMGCYGIGITRTVAAAIEQNHDDYGIIWPVAIAPYEVSILVLGDGEVLETGDQIYNDLQQEGIDVLFDDRKERAGVKFNDADLIGSPVRITIGSRSLAEGNVELKVRSTGEELKVSVDEVVDTIKELLSKLG
ncbi:MULTISPECIES: proline--tRNA ligase [unclassified Candidatus Frackibacter]|uniref:proline--tRNA ligase n=1 Tax=unclassified Candidatus Frackibacter TaxID=2648818 RepID=UPI00088C77EC|nr:MULTISPECIES: proline--tRNA ligase [unclassified Candidatus Frackibacter]SDB98635.1 prolyl-tRNA synthetase [Candidatus Frackibacter sp. WG11]SEM30447.1 prolyl-tRNA synthetase [Candidatus Frackibacter sp. WG12]SFL35364.1 prolyl-tRNA synthetase [Candidatus Frackibacter sp. WG13]